MCFVKHNIYNIIMGFIIATILKYAKPIDVYDVSCLGGKVCRKQMLGVHMTKNVDFTGLPRFLPHLPDVRRMGVQRVFTPF